MVRGLIGLNSCIEDYIDWVNACLIIVIENILPICGLVPSYQIFEETHAIFSSVGTYI